MAILQVLSKNGVPLHVHAHVTSETQKQFTQAALQAFAGTVDSASLLASGDYWPAGELDVVSPGAPFCAAAFELAAPARPSLTVIGGSAIRTPPRRPNLTLIQGDRS